MSTKLLDSEVFEKLGNHLKFTAQYADFCKLVEVTDDWYSNLDENKVFVGCWTTPAFPEYPSVYRCLVCGNDDYAYHKDVPLSEKESALDFMKQIPDGVDVEWFKKHGFTFY